jgi:hypothetical protein
MKKALLVTALVAFIALGAAFAEVTGVGEPEISGTMSLTAGWDFDYDASGFQNDNSITVKLPLLTGSETKGADDEIYGEIEVKDIGWYLQSDGGNFEFYDADEDDDFDTASQYYEETGIGDDADDDAVDEMGNLDASMSATLHFYDFYVKLGKPDFEMNNVDISDDYVRDGSAYVDWDTWSDGMALGFANDMFSFELKIASKDDAYMTPQDDDSDPSDGDDGPFDNDMSDYVDDSYTANDAHAYVVGAAISIMPAEGVKIPVTFSYDKDFGGTTGESDFIAVGAAPSVKAGMLKFDLPIDYISVTKVESLDDDDADDDFDDLSTLELADLAKDGKGTLSAFEMNPKLTYYLVEDGSNVAVDVVFGTHMGFGEFYGEDGDAALKPIFDAGLTFTEDKDNGFVPNLTASLGFTAVDMMGYDTVGENKAFGLDGNPMKWDVKTKVAYDLGGIEPYAGYEGDESGTDDINVGVKLMAAATGIDNTTITLDYKNDDITDTKGVDGDMDGEAGRLTLDITVKW